jgi:hypothetical protein
VKGGNLTLQYANSSKTLVKRDYTKWEINEDEEFEYKNSVEKNRDLILHRQNKINLLDSEIESIDRQIGLINGDTALKQKEIDDLRIELSLLQEDEEFDGKDLAGKEKMFDDLYKKKDEASQGGK